MTCIAKYNYQTFMIIKLRVSKWYVIFLSFRFSQRCGLWTILMGRPVLSNVVVNKGLRQISIRRQRVKPLHTLNARVYPSNSTFSKFFIIYKPTNTSYSYDSKIADTAKSYSQVCIKNSSGIRIVIRKLTFVTYSRQTLE